MNDTDPSFSFYNNYVRFLYCYCNITLLNAGVRVYGA